MTPVSLITGDCLEVLAAMPDASVDAIVTDPPYELGFMGKAWDASGIAYSVPLWTEALRVLKPGGHLLAFGGTRTYHRMTCAVEDAGFEVRDSIHWIYGSGFPKSLDVSKAIDKAAGATPDAAAWQGWGTALKPAHEPIVVARKPLVGTVAANVLAHGTGALNVDGCRVQMSDADREFILKTARPNSAGQEHVGAVMNRPPAPTVNVHDAGRWPANIVLDEAAADEMGEPARFFYCAKASTKERPVGPDGTKHATVKPLDLMRWLVRLVTPPGGTVLDPFAGSGTTLEAAILEGFASIGIERDPAHAELCDIRIQRSGGAYALPPHLL